MNRKISVLMMTVICGLGFGQEGSFSLFLESDPIGAFIEVNGVAQENFTPGSAPGSALRGTQDFSL
jgi:hypothetical protein